MAITTSPSSATSPAGRGTSPTPPSGRNRWGRRPSDERSPRPSKPGLIMVVVLVTQLMIVLDAAIVNIALPDIQTQLKMNPANLSWVVNAYTLAFGGLLLLGARAGDIFGRRRAFLAGLAIFTLSSFLGGIAQDSALLLASRALQGVGAALVAPSALAILMSSVKPGREQTRAIGLYTVVSASGAAIGLIAGGVLTSVASWRWVFFVNVPIGIVVLALGLRALPVSKITKGAVDVAGALLVTAGMSTLVYGFIRAASDGWSDSRTLASFAVGVAMMAAFILVERRAAAPITPLHLFAHRDRSVAYVARTLLVAGSMGTFFFMSQFMQIVLGWTPWESGLAFLPIPVSVFAASQLVSRVFAQRFSTKAIASTGLLLSGIGLTWMSILDVGSTYATMVPALVVFGLGNGIAFVPLTTAGIAGVEPKDTSVASGLVSVTQQLGGALGLAVLVSVFATAGKGAAQTSSAGHAALEVFVHGADRGFVVAGGLLIVAFLLVLTVMRRPQLAEADELVLAEAEVEVEAGRHRAAAVTD